MNVRPLAGAMASLGMPLYGCQTPDGYKQTQEAWLSPNAMLLRLDFATTLGTGRLPLQRQIDEFASVEQSSNWAVGIRRAEIRTLAGAASPSAELDPGALLRTIGGLISPHTREVVESAPPSLQAPLILGSPEFMRR